MNIYIPGRYVVADNNHGDVKICFVQLRMVPHVFIPSHTQTQKERILL